ncbi:MAG: adenylate/guanylate cyclase domain-containing protein [Chryseolinea sp.]
MDYIKEHGKWIAINAGTWWIAKLFFLAIRLWGIKGVNLNDAQGIDPGILFLTVALTGLFDGLAFGVLDTEFDKSFKTLSFFKRVFWKGIINFAVGLCLTILLVPPLMGWKMMTGMTLVADRLAGANLIIMITYIFVVTLLLQFGKYAAGWIHTNDLIQILKPEGIATQEDRIFMFLDMRDSTAHAEKLGPVRYSAMIQDCFQDMTRAASRSGGEIYQFVGDEAIFTWKTSDSNFQKCIRHYFEFRDDVQQRSLYYRSKYGVVPEFKAGIHHGKVIRTHVGVVRKSIAFHGDAVNTASRIQNKCNALGRDLLISAATRDRLAPTYNTTLVGRHQLRGKNDFMNLYSVAEPLRAAATIS